MSLDIHHDTAMYRFETEVDGQRCELAYRLEGATMTILHTGVPEAVGGRGIAAQLVEAAFLAARIQGWKVRPACSYAAIWAGKHPEFADVLA